MLQESIESFDLNTRQSTLEESAAKIKNARLKVEACLHFLKTNARPLSKMLDKTREMLDAKIARLSKDALDPDKVGKKSTAKPGMSKSILAIVRQASKKNPISKSDVLYSIMKLFPGRDKEKTEKTVNGMLLYNLHKNLGINVVKIRKEGVSYFYIGE
jgi:hypothetical protein